MVQTLIALMLVATQVLSWNAASVYLCVEADGTVCFDFGPATCGCCRAEVAAADHDHQGCDGHGCDGHDHGLARHGSLPADGCSGDDSCGCTHIQLSVPNSATLQRAVAASFDQDFSLPLAIVCDVVVGGRLFEAGEHVDRSIDFLPTALAERASIVLRC